MNIATSVDTTIINAINTNVSLSQSLLANIVMRRIFVDLRIRPFSKIENYYRDEYVIRK